MNALAILLTNAGYSALTNAQLAGDIDLAIASVGVTASNFVMAPTLTALPGEIKRINMISGEVTGIDTIHLTIADHSTDVYEMRGFGLFLADGTLLGVYGQGTPILEKAGMASVLMALDIKFLSDISSIITFGDANFTYPPATEEKKGVAEIATQAETDTGTDDERIVTPKKLAARLLAWFTGRSVLAGGLATGGGNLSADRTITVTAASAAEADAGANATKALTPASLANILTSIAGKALKTITVSGGGLVTGGGDLSANRTLSVTAATTAQIRALTDGTVAMTPLGVGGLTKTHAQNGAQEFIGGLIDKWGRFTATGNATTTITFPVAFPAECYVVLVGGGNTNVTEGDNFIELVDGSVSATGFQVTNGRAETISGQFFARGK